MKAQGSADRFAYSWGRYAWLLPDHEQQFRRWSAPLGPEDWRGRSFLDVGCGMGRNSHWPMRYGALGGWAIDTDERTLALARRNLLGFPALEVRRMSAYEIEAEARFDIVFSIGVLHHLEHPERALLRMVRAARPGGLVLIWVYGRENNEWIVRLVDPLRRRLFSRLPMPLLHALSWPPTAALFLALRLGLRRPEYFELIRRFSFAQLRVIVLDQLLPRISRYWRRAEVERLMAGAGLEDIRLTHVNGVSWSALGARPAAA